jgi:hypothetical protein
VGDERLEVDEEAGGNLALPLAGEGGAAGSQKAAGEGQAQQHADDGGQNDQRNSDADGSGAALGGG